MVEQGEKGNGRGVPGRRTHGGGLDNWLGRVPDRVGLGLGILKRISLSSRRIRLRPNPPLHTPTRPSTTTHPHRNLRLSHPRPRLRQTFPSDPYIRTPGTPRDLITGILPRFSHVTLNRVYYLPVGPLPRLRTVKSVGVETEKELRVVSYL